jgi:decaprenyl-phosphate phosphoribosyltransferase
MKFLRLLRPTQWVKNGFVLAPLIFSGDLSNFPIIASIKITVIFIITSSCIYIFNDIRDIKFDKLHPRNKTRPIANGEITVPTAFIFFIFLIVLDLSLILLFQISSSVMLLILTYFFLNFLYSMGLKNVPLLELGILASGFVIRLLAGALEASIILSPWIIICSGLLALMIAVGKRRNDLKHQVESKVPISLSLRGYNLIFLDHVNSMLASVTIVTYLLFCTSEYNIFVTGNRMLWTAPFVIFSILRYLQLIGIEQRGDDPLSMLLKDKTSVSIFTSWLLLIVTIIYL